MVDLDEKSLSWSRSQRPQLNGRLYDSGPVSDVTEKSGCHRDPDIWCGDGGRGVRQRCLT